MSVAPRERHRVSAKFRLKRPLPEFTGRNEKELVTTAFARLICQRGPVSNFPFNSSHDSPKPLLPLHSEGFLQAEMLDHVVRDSSHFIG